LLVGLHDVDPGKQPQTNNPTGKLAQGMALWGQSRLDRLSREYWR
jgi:hypothetical protein